MSKFLSLVFLFMMANSSAFAVPNLSKYAYHPSVITDYHDDNGWATMSFYSLSKVEESVVDGTKVFIGFEEATKTTIVFGRRNEEFYCELISKNGEKETATTRIIPTSGLSLGRQIVFTFPFGNKNWCTRCHVNFHDKYIALETLFIDPSFSPD